MQKRLHPTVSLLVAIVLHLVGDYVLQTVLSPLLPSKATLTGLICHCLYADTLAFAWVGYVVGSWKGALFGVLLAPVAHLSIDLFHIRGSVLLKLLDQGLHALLLSLFIVAIPSPYPTLETTHG
jgi:hypothetical protein